MEFETMDETDIKQDPPVQWRSQGGAWGAQAPLLRGCAPPGAPPLKILKVHEKLDVHLRYIA